MGIIFTKSVPPPEQNLFSGFFLLPLGSRLPRSTTSSASSDQAVVGSLMCSRGQGPFCGGQINPLYIWKTKTNGGTDKKTSKILTSILAPGRQNPQILTENSESTQKIITGTG